MVDFDKFKRAQYMTKRMVILKESCELQDVGIDYLFGLFNYYNQQNKGRWFWQKAVFTGEIKTLYDEVNKLAENLSKEAKKINEQTFNERITFVSGRLNELMAKMEQSLGVDRGIDIAKIEGFLDANMSALIKDSLRGIY